MLAKMLRDMLYDDRLRAASAPALAIAAWYAMFSGNWGLLAACVGDERLTNVGRDVVLKRVRTAREGRVGKKKQGV